MFDVAHLDIPPLVAAGGDVYLPGSKSISNRVLLLAALSHGRTTVRDLLASDDTAVMLAALGQLGCTIEEIDSKTIVIGGLGGQLGVRQASLFLGNAGTAMRPLTAALALLGGDFELSGVARMHERPIGDLVDALRQLGCHIDYTGNNGYPPLRLGTPSLTLDAPITVRGDVSSQFLTALLIALPLVAKQDIHIEVAGELISRPYVEITLNLLARFGIDVQRDGWQRFTIPKGSRYLSPGEIHVEGDASSASYFIALGAIAVRDRALKPLRIHGVGLDSIQGDIRFVDAARLMGARIEGSANSLQVSRGEPGTGWPLKAIDLDCNHIPDAAMTLAVMALYAEGTTVLRNIASWRVKETDRIFAMATELRKLGAIVEEGADYLKITPPHQWRAGSIHTYDDHRVAMCFSLAAFNPAGLPVRILDPKCVAKTYPDYFEALFAACEASPETIPVICIDGPTASGKGTLAAALAVQLGYHYLDSGALYRLTAFAAEQAGANLDDGHAVAKIAATLPISFAGSHIFLAGMDVTDAIRSESAGMAASKVSAHAQVRQALLLLQRGFRKLPGLVADGRDMGTVVFTDAPLKVYLTASARHRAERRHNQLISKGNRATLADIQQDLEARDARDMSRQAAPLKPADDARMLDNSDMSIEKSVDQVLDWWQGTRPF
ncbi:MAG: bifunctional 3-phosphoshikimate 1-carboxyvinyltransferase/cytidylate kinase [Polaromonas sp.]|nr:bifunctional 3-phosphoshikimate 1-carboxyvinyltransferase/cytidylate kinase [Polaromonas sp.]